MKKLMFMLLLAGSIQAMYAQKFSPNTPLFEELTDVKKKTDKFNLYLNMQGSFDAHFQNGFQEGDFNMHQLRIEAKGNINNWLSYRYRQRLNRSNDGNNMIDNLPTSIDWAGIGIKLNDKFNLFAGKQSANYGGFEFDLNPIDVYQYCDMIDYMSNFLTGLNASYNITPDQQLNLQILNSRNSSFDNTYGITEDAEGNLPDLKSGKMPLVYTLNWIGNFNNVFKTRWSASVMNEAKDHNMYYYAVGNELNLGKCNAQDQGAGNVALALGLTAHSFTGSSCCVAFADTGADTCDQCAACADAAACQSDTTSEVLKVSHKICPPKKFFVLGDAVVRA